ncbi:MAG TPA: riboflavin synthase [Thermoleophilaceae bacterium]|nr:riboflavin synthase [Thermoleophilaceae bacterium]
MFTGLVEDRGRVSAAEGDGGLRLTVATRLAAELEPGDSVAVNGVCLTAATVADGAFIADVMPETARRSSLAALAGGDDVNLELPLRAGQRLGGHIVQGHVDGVGEVEWTEAEGAARVVRVATSPELLRYVVEKGSIAVDGVSLTVASVDDEGFTVSLVPETLTRTTLGAAEAGRAVNLEVDMLAKHVEKLLPRKEAAR